MPRMTALSTLTCTALLFTAGMTLCGCQTPDPDAKYRTDLDSLEADLTPELANTAQSHDERRMDWAVNRNQDLRSANSDMDRFWLTDKPRPLSPYPIMETGGNP